MDGTNAISEKEFLIEFAKRYETLNLKYDINDNVRETFVDQFLKQHHYIYYEVEFHKKSNYSIHSNNIAGIPWILDESLPDNVIEFRTNGKLTKRILLPLDIVDDREIIRMDDGDYSGDKYTEYTSYDGKTIQYTKCFEDNEGFHHHINNCDLTKCDLEAKLQFEARESKEGIKGWDI